MKITVGSEQCGGNLENVGEREVFFPPLPEISDPDSFYEIVVDVSKWSPDIVATLRVYLWPGEGEPPLWEVRLGPRNIWQMAAYSCGLHVSLQADAGIIASATLTYAIRSVQVSSAEIADMVFSDPCCSDAKEAA